MVKKFLGLIVILLGIAMLSGSFYIKGEVKAGKATIVHAKEAMEKGSKLIPENRAAKEIEKKIKEPVEKTLKKGALTTEYYETVAFWLMIGGVVFIVGGGIIVFLGRKKQNS